jgi:hypothetical protein
MSTFVLSNKSFGPAISKNILKVSDKDITSTPTNHSKEDFSAKSETKIANDQCLTITLAC